MRRLRTASPRTLCASLRSSAPVPREGRQPHGEGVGPPAEAGVGGVPARGSRRRVVARRDEAGDAAEGVEGGGADLRLPPTWTMGPPRVLAVPPALRMRQAAAVPR